ncbi:unnamed protein product [Mytilus edulis]|uniref:Uncharacterized protein n=1 Tax=Mytilus edulis TaxID=6550 RepID=A0A8S3TF98_MYTED|nr:unnamed protein product [Mytilus edulis]
MPTLNINWGSRAAVTKVLNKLEDAIVDTPFDPAEISALLEAVEKKKKTLGNIDEQILNTADSDGITDEKIESDEFQLFSVNCRQTSENNLHGKTEVMIGININNETLFAEIFQIRNQDIMYTCINPREDLCIAATTGDLEKVRNCLAEGADINYEYWILWLPDCAESKVWFTPLHAAAEGVFINIVKLLLERTDIDPKKENKYGATPLHAAAEGGFINIVQLLLERADIDPNKENMFEGDTPLHLAVSGGNLDIVKLFLQRADIDPSKENKDGSTPFDIAAEEERFKILKLLLERTTIDLKKVYKDGNTVLHKATRSGELELVQLLLKTSNIDPNQKNKVRNEV